MCHIFKWNLWLFRCLLSTCSLVHFYCCSKNIIQTYFFNWWIVFFKFIRHVCFFRMSQPLFIGGLLAYFNPNGSDRTIEYAYVCASGILFSMLASFILRHSTSIAISNCGMKIRVACCSTIFRKVLKKKKSLPHNFYIVFNHIYI